MPGDITDMRSGSVMKNRMSVKVTFNYKDPFDAEIIPILLKETNRAGFLRKAVFCFVRGLGMPQTQVPVLSDGQSKKERQINEKLAKLTDF